MNVTKEIARLLERCDSGPLTVWLGAGASFASGLPLAGTLIEAILGHTALGDDDRASVAAAVPATVPFERLMEVVLDLLDLRARREFLSLFAAGRPGPHHEFVARLAVRGRVRCIATTNFDLHAETALADEGLVIDRDYRVWDEPDVFDQIAWESAPCHVVKLHGTVRDTDRLGVTVRRIAASGFTASVTPVVARILDPERNTPLLVIGYSFSDRFDLSPAMRSVVAGGTSQEVYHLEYRQGDRTDWSVERAEATHPLVDCQGYRRIVADPIEVVGSLASALGLEPLSEPEGSVWREHLGSTLERLEERNGELVRDGLAGSFLAMIARHTEAVPYLKRAVAAASETSQRVAALQALAGSLIETGELEESERVLHQALGIARDLEDGRHADHALAQLGAVHRMLGDAHYARALVYYEEARSIVTASDEEGALRHVAHLSGMAVCWMRLGDFDAAKRCYETAAPIVERSGDIYRKAELYGNIGSLLSAATAYDQAIAWYGRAIAESEHSGDLYGLGTHRMNRAIPYFRTGQGDAARADLAAARTLLVPILDSEHATLRELVKREEQMREDLGTGGAVPAGRNRYG